MKDIVLKYLCLLDIDSIGKKMVLCSNYPNLDSKIPDSKLILETVFSKEELIEVYYKMQPYLQENSICPIIEVLGGNVICLGFSPLNEGNVYYLDMDFGLYELDQTFKEFIERLVDSDFNYYDHN